MDAPGRTAPLGQPPLPRAGASGRGQRICYWLTVAISDLQRLLRDFTAERHWEQFHTPKNLVMALSGEVGELTEIFQWLTPEESAAVLKDAVRAARVREEIADVFAYLLRLADVLGLDLEAAVIEKSAMNAAKYPVDTARGNAAKYSDLPAPRKS